MDKQFEKELEKTNKFVSLVYDKMNLFPNPNKEINDITAQGLTSNKLKHGSRYCPCFVVIGETKEEKKKLNDRVCPCKPALEKEIPEDGICHCGIFCTSSYVDNYVKLDVSIIEHKLNLNSENLNPLFKKDEINSVELVDLLDGRNSGLVNFILIDVREIIENNTKMIIGMDYLIPTSDLGNGLDSISDKKEENIVVHCHSGSRSAKVQEIMKSIGFKTVINLSGGIVSYGGETK